jgi:cytochrome c biogenesis protein CcmG/thiol:disulfide interchange protein DsbE
VIRWSSLAVVIVVAGCTSSDKPDAGGAADGRVEVGAPAPSYSAVALNGDSVSLAGQKGKVVLLNVWATWCHPCRDEIPELRALHDRFQARGLEVVGVSVDAGGTEDGIRAFMKDFKMTYPVWHDPDERISARFLTFGVPTTYLIDREGILRWRKTGPIMPNDTSLAAVIERALGT